MLMAQTTPGLSLVLFSTETKTSETGLTASIPKQDTNTQTVKKER